LNNEQKRIFVEEYERERARDAFRAEKEAKSATVRRKLQYVYDAIIVCVLVYLVVFLRDSFGFGNVVIFDAQFFRPLLLIIAISLLGFVIFPKNKQNFRRN
jgi:hypothetical protein